MTDNKEALAAMNLAEAAEHLPVSTTAFWDPVRKRIVEAKDIKPEEQLPVPEVVPGVWERILQRLKTWI